MSSHTPGPWYIGTDFSDQGRHIYAAHKVRHEDGDEWNPLIASTDDDERLIDWQANARLIAAAPEMFAALVALLPHAARAIQGTTEGQPLLDAARAAIAKATQDETP